MGQITGTEMAVVENRNDYAVDNFEKVLACPFYRMAWMLKMQDECCPYTVSIGATVSYISNAANARSKEVFLHALRNLKGLLRRGSDIRDEIEAITQW